MSVTYWCCWIRITWQCGWK